MGEWLKDSLFNSGSHSYTIAKMSLKGVGVSLLTETPWSAGVSLLTRTALVISMYTTAYQGVLVSRCIPAHPS